MGWKTNIQEREMRMGDVAVTEKPEIVQAPQELKIDLACGQSPREGFDGADISPCKEVKHVLNLWQFPWPWATSSVAELHCSHHIEHIPMCYIRPQTYTAQDGTLMSTGSAKYAEAPDCPGCKDLFVAFMDECYRVLKPNGKLTIICPNARSNRAFQDPTHRRFIVAESFGYFNKKWRDDNKLDHYGIESNFEISVNPIISQDMTLLHPEAQARQFNMNWNVVHDWHAVLTAVK